MSGRVGRPPLAQADRDDLGEAPAITEEGEQPAEHILRVVDSDLDRTPIGESFGRCGGWRRCRARTGGGFAVYDAEVDALSRRDHGLDLTCRVRERRHMQDEIADVDRLGAVVEDLHANAGE
jgi:hypothetical protein